MRWWRNSLLAAVIAAALLQAQSGINMERVGSHIACQCGCSHTVATCDMFECHFSSPAKQRIIRMQKAGVSDQAIIDSFIKDYGQGVYRASPNSLGWIVPYTTLLAGLFLIWWFVKRYYRRPAAAGAAPEVDDAQLSQYRAQIEKDLAHLE